MKQIVRAVFAVAALVALPTLSYASAISIYAAAPLTHNGDVNPCVFTGNGDNGCSQLDFAFPDPVVSTQQFDTNPLVNTYGDVAGELAQFAVNVGRDFFLGIDINEGGPAQTITNLTITFFDINGAVLGSGYQLGNLPVTVPVIENGEGYTDYIATAGCLGTTAGTGVAATCSNYAPFSAPTGTRSLTFTYGMGGFNDGAERLFLVKAGPTAVPFNEDPPTSVPDGGATIALLGMSLVGLAYARRKFSI